MEGILGEDRAAVAAASSALRRLMGRLHQVGSDELGPVFGELDELKLLAEAAQVGVLDQGLTRGEVKASDAASPAGWVRRWGPSYVAGGAAALVRVTRAIAQPRNEPAAGGGARGAGAGAQRRGRADRDGACCGPG